MLDEALFMILRTQLHLDLCIEYSGLLCHPTSRGMIFPNFRTVSTLRVTNWSGGEDHSRPSWRPKPHMVQSCGYRHGAKCNFHNREANPKVGREEVYASNAASTFAAASSCMCASTCEYTSKVNAARVCPSCSDTTFGETPTVSARVAAVCRRS